MRHLTSLTLAALSAAAAPLLAAARPASAQISDAQAQQILRNQEKMQADIDALKAAKPAPTSQQAATQEDLDDLETRMRQIGRQVHGALPGTEHLVILGDAAVGFVNQKKTNSTFFAGVAPLFLWEPTDRLLFEAAMDIGIGTDPTNASSTSVDLTIANASYIVNDYLIVGGGLFVVPFGQYHNHFDPPWINKLPDDPLVFSDGGLAPGSQVGVFARGAAPVCDAKIVYDVYLTNGPNVITNDPAAAGSLNFDDFTDLNNGKAVGGRLGFLPVPNVEFGYSFQYAQTAPNGFQKVYAFLQAADLNWVQEVRPLAGVFTLRAEWVWSDVERATYDANGSAGFGPLNFGNYRTGGYALLAYRPTLVTNRYLKNTEFVFRYDALRSPVQAPGGDTEQRYTFGIDYWLTPSAVLKVAYEIDNKKVGADQDAFYVQFGIGL